MKQDNTQEGVIQFGLDYMQAAAPDTASVAALGAWRTILHDLQLIGQNPQRYDGYGFGNISMRTPANPAHFIVTGSQTGKARVLDPSGFCTVTAADPAHNRIAACGPCKPSSESMTHAALYQALPEIGAVVHVHAPAIWHAVDQLRVGTTAADIPYGTPAMAAALQQQALQQPACPAAILLGHQDGIITWGPTLQAASQVCIDLLAQSLALSKVQGG